MPGCPLGVHWVNLRTLAISSATQCACSNNFLNLLVEKDRLALLEEICESFEELYCKLTDTQVLGAASSGQQRGRLGGVGGWASQLGRSGPRWTIEGMKQGMGQLQLQLGAWGRTRISLIAKGADPAEGSGNGVFALSKPIYFRCGSLGRWPLCAPP